MSPLLMEAMLIKSYEEKWFRDPIVKYVHKTTDYDMKYEDDKRVLG